MTNRLQIDRENNSRRENLWFDFTKSWPRDRQTMATPQPNYPQTLPRAIKLAMASEKWCEEERKSQRVAADCLTWCRFAALLVLARKTNVNAEREIEINE